MPFALPERHLALRPLLLAILAVLTAMLVVAPNSFAATTASVTKVFGGPIAANGACSADGTAANTDADKYSDFCLAFASSNPDGPSGKDLTSQVIDTPQGFAGNVDNISPQCTDAQFAVTSASNSTCDSRSQIGAVSSHIVVGDVPFLGTLSLDPTGNVYALTHTDNEVARLGIDLRPVAPVLGAQPDVKIIVRVLLRPSPDVGLRSIIDGLPKTADTSVGNGKPLELDSFALTFWGSGSDHPTLAGQSFAFLGSDCNNLQSTHLSAVAEDGSTSSKDSATYQLTNCDSASIPFRPSAEYTTTDNKPDVTTQTNVFVRFAGSDTAGYVQSTVKKTIVTLPTGLSFSGQIASGANGLPLCTPDQFAQNAPAASTCPDATAVGTVKFTSPVLAHTLNGTAWLGPQNGPTGLPDLYIQASLGGATGADAPRVKLLGKLTIDDQDRIVTTLDNLPQVPVSEFALSFRGGDQSAIVTPPQCGTYQGALSAFSWSKQSAPVDSAQSYSVTDDCDAVKAFAPSVGFKVDNAASAGQHSPLTTTISRPDRSPRITHTVLNLPAGELASLKGVPECSAADASASKCADSSKVGTISSLAGVGPAPYTANGTVYLTARQDGDVADLSLHVPVKFGEVNLGDLNVPARIQIRGDDLGLRVIADVPTRFAGIPLNIRQLSINLDRPNFSLSPTNCAVLSNTSLVTDDAGNTASIGTSFQIAGCAGLGFAPQLGVAVNGQTNNKGRPNVAVRISSPDGTSALRQTFVTLPKGLSVDLQQIPRACSVDDFKNTKCPGIAAIGKVSGTLAITDEPLTGDVYLLKVPGQVLPGIGLAFKGRFSGNVQGTTAIDPKTSQLLTNFTAIPDLPLTALEIDITGGTGGILIATSTLCDAASVDFVGRFVAQSGPTVTRTTSTFCGSMLNSLSPKITGAVKGVRKGKPSFSLTGKAPVAKGVQLKIKRVDVTFPSGYSLSTSRAKSSKGVAVKSLSVKGKTTTKRSGITKLRVTLPAAGTTKFHLLTRTGTFAIKSHGKRKSKAKLTLTVSVTFTSGQKTVMPVRLTPH